jgi:hypothetical protein
VSVVFEVDTTAVGFGITPSSQTVYTGDTITFSVIGGTGPVFTYAVTTNGSGADPMSGNSYVAGPLDAVTPSALDTVTITDTEDMSTATATITVMQKDLVLNNPTATVVVGGSLDLVNVGGTGDFSYEVTTNNSNVPDDMTGPSYASGTAATYVAGSTGGVTDVVTMTDSYDGRSRTATIDVIDSPPPPPLDVEYVVSSVSSGTPSPAAGAAISETFTLHNTGTDNGSASVSWTAFISEDNDLGTPPNFIVASDVEPALDAGQSSNPAVDIGGFWPETPGQWYLIVRERSDDEITINDVGWAGPFDVQGTTINVDYAVSTPPPGGSRPANGAISESFQIRNEGTAAGGSVSWTAYLSSDTRIDSAPTDSVIGSGTISLGLAAGEFSPLLFIDNGSWPGSAQTSFIIIRLQAADDVELDNNVFVSEPYYVSDPAVVDYTVSEITFDDPTPRAGRFIQESFTITNAGGSAGALDVDWELYVSSTTTPSGGPVATGTISGGLSAGSSYTVGSIPALWPNAPGTDRYLVVSLTATDDNGTLADEIARGPYTLQGSPDYSVLASLPTLPVVVEGGNSNTGETLADIGLHSFTISEGAGYAGNEPVAWSAHWSLDSTLDGSDIEIDSGILSPTEISPSVTVFLPSTTPLPTNWGYWRIIVSVDSADDPGAVNDTFASGEIAIWQTTGNADTDPVGVYTDDDLYVGEEDDFAVLLNVGDSVEITGNIDEATYNDLYKVTLGAGVTAIRAVATWSTGDDTLDLYMYQLGDSPTAPPYRAVEVTPYDIEDSDAVSPPDTPWTGLTSGGVYYVNVYSLAANPDRGSPYTLTLTAY